jgi:hypothetical protein
LSPDPTAGLPCRVRTLLVTLLVLAAAAVGGDRVAEHVAAGRAEDRLAAHGVSDPQVDVAGFPFLTQLLSRHFGDVSMTGSAVEVNGTHADGVQVRATDVDVPASGDATAGTVRATLLVTYQEVLDRAGLRGLRMSPAGGGDVRLRGSVEVLGSTVDVTTVGTVRAHGARIEVVPQSFELADGGSVSGSLKTLLADRFGVSYTLRSLPDGVSVRRVAAGPDGFLVTLVGTDVSMDAATLR